MATTTSAASNNLVELDEAAVRTLKAGRIITSVQHSPPGVRAQALIRCPPQQLLALLTNYQSMPQHIFGLERADVLRSHGDTASVRFTMKLPFPVGRITWTNSIQRKVIGGIYSLDWTLVDGDLEFNDGRLVMTTHREDGAFTYANYTVRVRTRSRLPRSAERLATCWLLPKIVGTLRRVAEEA